MTKPACQCCHTDEFVKVSSGPGRRIGPIANSIWAVNAPLPSDFEYLYCSKCDNRILDKETIKRFNDYENLWVGISSMKHEELCMALIVEKGWTHALGEDTRNQQAQLDAIATVLGVKNRNDKTDLIDPIARLKRIEGLARGKHETDCNCGEHGEFDCDLGPLLYEGDD